MQELKKELQGYLVIKKSGTYFGKRPTDDVTSQNLQGLNILATCFAWPASSRFIVGVCEAKMCECGDLDSSESDVDSGESEPAPCELSSLISLSASELRTPVTWLMCQLIPSTIRMLGVGTWFMWKCRCFLRPEHLYHCLT